MMLSNKLDKSRKAWIRQTSALGKATGRASKAFATDTADATTKFGKFARGEVRAWTKYIQSSAPEVVVPTMPSVEAIAPQELERALLTRLIAALEVLLVRSRSRLAALAGVGDALPIADYETLTARAILAEIDALDTEACLALRSFEAKNKARATVLKALDQRL
jgi:hypothetical protein